MGERTEVGLYYGHSRHGIDGSCRLLVPRDWRPEGGPTQFMVIPWPFDQPAHEFLMVLPLDQYTTISQHLRKQTVLKEEMTTFKRVIGYCSKRVEFDRFGRLALSESLLQSVGIGAEAELVGAVDHFEIWSPERIQAALPGHRKTAADVKPTIPADLSV